MGTANISVASLAGAPRAITEWNPDGVVSVFSPGRRVAELASRPHLRLMFADIEAPARGHRRGPGAHHVELFLKFLEEQQPQRLLVHCTAGLSRAPAFAILAMLKQGMTPALAVAAMKRAAPHAQPNRFVLALAEQTLGVTGVRAAAEAAFRYRRAAFGAVGPMVDWFVC